MQTGTERVLVFVLDANDCRIVETDIDGATTLVAVASEDPSNWNDVVGFWPRYRSPLVPESPDSLPSRMVDRETAEQTVDEWLATAGLHDKDNWVWLDMFAKRIVTGSTMKLIEPAINLSLLFENDNPDHGFIISIQLAPWWEMSARVPPEVIHLPRREPLYIPQANRVVLYGDALIHHFVDGVLDAVQSESWEASGADYDKDKRYPFTVDLHRDWLLTPLEELEGSYPRTLLHGAHEWADSVARAHHMRAQQTGELIAIPTDYTGYETAPVSGQELVLYFDLCRELIQAGWNWYDENIAFIDLENRERCTESLTAFLNFTYKEWMETPYEENKTPKFHLECLRRRVPVFGGRKMIAGMDGVELNEHIDCNCGPCEAGRIGSSKEINQRLSQIGYSGGWYLEDDRDWAFSRIEKYDSWFFEHGPIDFEKNEEGYENEKRFAQQNNRNLLRYPHLGLGDPSIDHLPTEEISLEAIWLAMCEKQH